MDELDKKALKILSSLIVFVVVIAVSIGAVAAHYQSRLTGYDFWECFWAGSTVDFKVATHADIIAVKIKGDHHV